MKESTSKKVAWIWSQIKKIQNKFRKSYKGQMMAKSQFGPLLSAGRRETEKKLLLFMMLRPDLDLKIKKVLTEFTF